MKKLPIIVALAVSVFISSVGCKKKTTAESIPVDTAKADSNVVDTSSLHYRVSGLLRKRHWSITYHDKGPTYDSTYSFVDSFALVTKNNDTSIQPFEPYSRYGLSLRKFSTNDGYMWYFGHYGNSGNTDHIELYYFYSKGVDSVWFDNYKLMYSQSRQITAVSVQ